MEKSSPVSCQLAWTHPTICSISACLPWGDADSCCTFSTCLVGEMKNTNSLKERRIIFLYHGLREGWSIHTPTVPSGLNVLSYCFNPQKSDWQTSPLGHRGSAGISDTGMFLPSISSPTSFSAHRQHTQKNKQQIRYQWKKLPAAGPHGSGPDLAVKGGICGSLLPGRGPRFHPNSTGVLPAQRNECAAAEQSVGLAPPTITAIPPRMIDALSAPYSREKALDICIIDWGWEKRVEKGWKKGEKEKQGDRLCGCVFALEWDIGHGVCVLVASSVC